MNTKANNKPNLITGACAIGISALCLSTSLHAAVITGVTAEFTSTNSDFNSITGGNASSYNVNNIVNGTGLTGTTHTNSFGSSMLHDNDITEADATIIFNLGGVYNVESLNVWNYNSSGTTNRGLKTVTVETSTDGLTYGTPGTLTFAQANNPNSPAEVVAFSASGVQFIKFTNLTTHAGASSSTGGLSEIQFVAQVPEPSSLALLGLGFSSLMLRRRRS